MQLSLFKKKKEEAAPLKTTIRKTNGDIQIIQMISATVIEVGDDEAEDGFSYKYSFINPINQKMEEATDFLQDITVGEQLFDVGDEIDIIFTGMETDPSDYTVTRQMVFPKLLKKRRNIRILGKIAYVIVMIILAFICCFASGKSAQKDLSSNEVVIEETTESQE